MTARDCYVTDCQMRDGAHHDKSPRTGGNFHITRCLPFVLFGNNFPIMNTTDTLNDSLVRLLRPLVRVLLRLGVPYGTFAELARRVYVEVADKDFPPPGRKQSDSRIATITGLTRKDVLRLKREPLSESQQLIERFNRAARVIGGWTSDPAFLEDGKARALAPEGPSPSFSELVARHSGDVPTRAILDELLRVGAVRQDEQGLLHLVRPAWVPGGDTGAKVGILGTDVADLIHTIDHNLQDDAGKGRFQLKVSYDNLPGEVLSAFHEQVSRQGYALLKTFDGFLREHDRDHNPDARGTGRVRAGVGIYYFEESREQE